MSALHTQVICDRVKYSKTNGEINEKVFEVIEKGLTFDKDRMEDYNERRKGSGSLFRLVINEKLNDEFQAKKLAKENGEQTDELNEKTLSKMNVGELKEIAFKRQIEVAGLNKSEIVAEILKSIELEKQ